ncbi:MAG: DUF2207 domain-containing protein [Deltaproteobacteria bacterium]|nr:DUF2207 domain-containing protein [Deltaproteobacteria bacterium]
MTNILIKQLTLQLNVKNTLYQSILTKLIITIAFYLSISLLSLPLHAEEIRNFYSEIFITKAASITVQENIEYDFGDELRHGIFREIPYEYQVDIRNYNLRMDVNKVTNFEGSPYNYKVTRGNGRVTVRIGDPDKEITGVHGYRIDYFVERAIVFFKDHDELYWNVTGNEWKIPIRKASAKIYLEGEMPEGVKAKCYTGYYGSKEQNCTFNITPHGIEFNVFGAGDSSRNFGPGEGLTIVVGLSKGVLKEPSTFNKASWFISDNWFFALPFLTLFFISYIWYTRGRDPEGKGVILVRYEPPKDLTPAEAGTLIDERADILDITSTVIDLAVRGYLKIKDVQSTKFYFFSDRDYKLIKIKEPIGNELKTYEKEVFSGIFGSKDKVMISDLKNKFYTRIPPIKDSLYKGLVSGGYFSTNPEKIRSIFKWVGIGMVGISFFFIPYWGMKLSLMLSGIFILIFSRFMPRKTKKGAQAKEELLGFREFIERAETDRIERLANDDPTLFDRVLPYALVFELGDRWAEAFRDMYKTPPSWYDSPGYSNSFSPHIFVNDIGRSLSVMNSTFASTPRSSGGAGGSGFSGGGSSGGGFGGGGGGSW